MKKNILEPSYDLILTDLPSGKYFSSNVATSYAFTNHTRLFYPRKSTIPNREAQLPLTQGIEMVKRGSKELEGGGTRAWAPGQRGKEGIGGVAESRLHACACACARRSSRQGQTTRCHAIGRAGIVRWPRLVINKIRSLTPHGTQPVGPVSLRQRVR